VKGLISTIITVFHSLEGEKKEKKGEKKEKNKGGGKQSRMDKARIFPFTIN